MRITIELTPTEMMRGLKNGTLEAFLGEAVEAAAIAPPTYQPAPVNAIAPAPAAAPVVTPAPAATFNPTFVAPAPVTPAAQPAFDPTAIVAPAPAAPAPAAQPAPPVIPPTGQAQATIDEVRAKIAPLIKAGKVAEMQALFAEFGAQKLTDVNPAHYAALIARAATI